MARRRSIWKGAVAGMAGGLLAAWVMNEAQAGLSAVGSKLQQNGSSSSNKQENSGESEDATMKTADRVATVAIDRPLNKEEKKKAGPLVHYAFGTLMGGLYGATAERVPQVKSGWGLLFGTALFLGADEVAVPALGLGPSPTETKAQDHLYGLVSHFVYGATTETVRRGVRAYL